MNISEHQRKQEVIKFFIQPLEQVFGRLSKDETDHYAQRLSKHQHAHLMRAKERIEETKTTRGFPLPAVILKAIDETKSHDSLSLAGESERPWEKRARLAEEAGRAWWQWFFATPQAAEAISGQYANRLFDELQRRVLVFAQWTQKAPQICYDAGLMEYGKFCEVYAEVRKVAVEEGRIVYSPSRSLIEKCMSKP